MSFIGFYFKLLKVLNIQITKPYINLELERMGESMVNREFVNIVTYDIVLLFSYSGEGRGKTEICCTKTARKDKLSVILGKGPSISSILLFMLHSSVLNLGQ